MKPELIGLVVLVAAALLFIMRPKGELEGGKARELVEGGALLLDVRTPAEYAEGHIDGAINIPVDALAGRLSELPDQERPIVVYCRSGARSARAKNTLQNSGYKTIYDLGPMTAYR